MKKTMKKALSGAMSTAMFAAAGMSQVAVVAEEAAIEQSIAVEVKQAEAVKTDAVENVKGEFEFCQEIITPTDDLFSVFGTVVTGMCAKPAFVTENGNADFYVNVKGKIAKAYTVNLKEENTDSRVLLCSCATGAATANVEITGVKLADVLTYAQLEEGVNTVTVKGSDGYGMALPLSYALEKEAVIVYKINGEAVPSGTQFWVPETVAKYFTRDVVEIELTTEAEVPEVEQRAEELRAEVAFLNHADGGEFQVGEVITFEGYADDCGDAIAAVEFSMDEGKTWTTFATDGATADRWVHWNFHYTPEAAGTYKLMVQAKTVSGNVSPLAAHVVFTVE